MCERALKGTARLQVVWKLSQQDNVSFAGKHYEFENVTIAPKPFNPDGPPIWLVVHAHGENELAVDLSHKRIITYADGWQTLT